MQGVTHQGVITETYQDYIKVVLKDTVACASCQLKSACGSDQTEVSEFRVPTQGKQYKKGDFVTVGIQQSMGLKAVFLAYVMPFLILMSILIFSQNKIEEWMTGLIAIAGIAIYFIILKRLDHYLSKFIHIKILNTNE